MGEREIVPEAYIAYSHSLAVPFVELMKSAPIGITRCEQGAATRRYITRSRCGRARAAAMATGAA
jgi:hypothetical protein